MAPVNPILTQRVYIDYQGLSGQHSLQLRYRPDVTFSQAQVNTIAFAELLKPVWFDDVTVTGFRSAPAGQAFTFPFPPPVPIVGQVVGALTGRDFPRFASYSARSVAGRRVRWTLYETNIGIEDDYRVETLSADEQAIFNFLQDFGNGVCDVTANGIILYNYINVGYNAYYQRKQRG